MHPACVCVSTVHAVYCLIACLSWIIVVSSLSCSFCLGKFFNHFSTLLRLFVLLIDWRDTLDTHKNNKHYDFHILCVFPIFSIWLQYYCENFQLFLACLEAIQSENILTDIDQNKLFSNIREICESNIKFWTTFLYPMVCVNKNIMFFSFFFFFSFNHWGGHVVQWHDTVSAPSIPSSWPHSLITNTYSSSRIWWQQRCEVQSIESGELRQCGVQAASSSPIALLLI